MVSFNIVYSCLLFTSVQSISLSISITVMPSNLHILPHLNISVTHGLKADTHTFGHKVLCVYDLPEADLTSAKAAANGKPCNISPVHRSLSHPLRQEVLWGKRCSAAECHWDVCGLTCFSFPSNEGKMAPWGAYMEVTVRKANLKKNSKQNTEVFVFRRTQRHKT